MKGMLFVMGRGIGQVMFQNNALSGFLMLAGILVCLDCPSYWFATLVVRAYRSFYSFCVVAVGGLSLDDAVFTAAFGRGCGGSDILLPAGFLFEFRPGDVSGRYDMGGVAFSVGHFD